MKKLIFLADIDFESSPKVRAEINPETAQEYADAIKGKAVLPPPDVFQGNGSKHFLVADGRHRLQGIRLLGRKACECELHSGGYKEALKFAITANVKHGLRRTNADKRATVEAAVESWPELSTQELAAMCCVSVGFVNSVRREDMPGKDENDPANKGEESASHGGPNESHKENKENSSSEKKKSEKKEEEKKPEPPKDEMGFPLTPLAFEYFSRAQEVQDLMTKASQIRSLLKNAQEGKDLLFGNLYSQLVTPLDLVYGLLSSAKPYAACLICNGTLKDTQKRKIMGSTIHDPKGQVCQYCHGTGVMSKFAFDANSRTFPDLKQIRVKAL